MKGIVFTEFLELVEDKFSPEMADKIIEASNLESDGAYTTVGVYHHSELIDMVVNLSKETGVDVPALVKVFGHYMFSRFHAMYPAFFESSTSSFDFLNLVENHIHVEVKKLYPEAELPTFETTAIDDNTLEMIYISDRPFAALAEGLIEGCIEFYNEKVDLKVEDLSGGEGNNSRFTLTKLAA